MKNILTKFLKVDFLKERVGVGLDIGSSAVKIAKLKFGKDSVELLDFAIEPARLSLDEALNKAGKPHGLGLVNTAVSGSQTVVRYANFPKMNNAELRQALKFEAQKHIPFSVAEVNLDGYILKDDLAENKMLVLIAAAKKELVSLRLKSLEKAGLAARIVDTDSIALINAFTFNNPSLNGEERKAVALLNIGASMSNLNILESGIPRLSRDVHIAGDNITKKIMEISGIDFDNAENIKLNPGQGENLSKANSAAEAIATILAAEVRTSFDYYESQGASSVVKIFLSGGGGLFSGFKDMLARSLGIEVEYWNPLKNIRISEGIDSEKAKEACGRMAVAIGLALRS